MDAIAITTATDKDKVKDMVKDKIKELETKTKELNTKIKELETKTEEEEDESYLAGYFTCCACMRPTKTRCPYCMENYFCSDECMAHMHPYSRVHDQCVNIRIRNSKHVAELVSCMEGSSIPLDPMKAIAMLKKQRSRDSYRKKLQASANQASANQASANQASANQTGTDTPGAGNDEQAQAQTKKKISTEPKPPTIPPDHRFPFRLPKSALALEVFGFLRTRNDVDRVCLMSLYHFLIAELNVKPGILGKWVLEGELAENIEQTVSIQLYSGAQMAGEAGRERKRRLMVHMAFAQGHRHLFDPRWISPDRKIDKAAYMSEPAFVPTPEGGRLLAEWVARVEGEAKAKAKKGGKEPALDDRAGGAGGVLVKEEKNDCPEGGELKLKRKHADGGDDMEVDSEETTVDPTPVKRVKKADGEALPIRNLKPRQRIIIKSRHN